MEKDNNTEEEPELNGILEELIFSIEELATALKEFNKVLRDYSH